VTRRAKPTPGNQGLAGDPQAGDAVNYVRFQRFIQRERWQNTRQPFWSTWICLCEKPRSAAKLANGPTVKMHEPHVLEKKPIKPKWILVRMQF
jgi:hypothetical protein